MNSCWLNKWIVIAVVSMAGLGGGGCKQARGERCQASSDCEDGLICSQAEPRTCGGANDEQIDAYVPPDAPPPPVDAAVDAPIDVAPP